MIILSHQIDFPPTDQASEDGLLCIGGDLHPERLMLAYRRGIFPWYNEGEPICWYAPPARFVLFPRELIVHKSMQQLKKKNKMQITFSNDFAAVIHHCKTQKRKGQNGTWITDEMELAYIQLHHAGFALSAECREDGILVGGLYGIRLNRVFCGESMFSMKPDASKLAFIDFVQHLHAEGIELIDCQVYTPHLESLGARMISRKEFETYL